MKRVPRVIVSCLHCSGDISTPEWRIRAGGAKFCNKVCKDNYLVGKPSPRLGMKQPTTAGANNHRWNGGKSLHEKGYILVKAPIDHPYKLKSGYIREHRLVMERHLGRYLMPDEDVHHLDHNKTNNDINNLELFANRSEHLKKYHTDNGKEYRFKKGQNNHLGGYSLGTAKL